MKNLFLFTLLSILFSTQLFSQDLQVQTYNPPLPYSGSTDWGTDYVVSNSEPLGAPTGVYRQSNSTIYVAVPDTAILSDKSIVVLTSTDNGATWAISASVSPANHVPKTKMLKTTTDEVYCFFLLGTTVYCWNVITSTINPYTAFTDVYDFDAATSSTGSLYLIIDLISNNQVRFAGTTDGGASWVGAVFLSSAAARPRLSMSGTGDTLLINYYGPIAGLSDTTTAAIRNVRYRETSPGLLTVSGATPTFTTIVPAGTRKPEFQGVLNGGVAWVFYTTESGGNTDLNCMIGIDNGSSYGAPFTIGAMPDRNEHWFDAKHNKSGDGGVDLVYYSDTIPVVPPTNESRKLLYTSATVTAPNTFTTPEQFSEHPPVVSDRGYYPSIIPYHDAIGDVGVIWVGLDGTDRKLYFDRLHKLVNISNEIETPEGFYLKQNFPNPFNPSTKIEFAIPKSEYVTLKIFDVLGKEITTLINGEMNSGIYEIEFNATGINGLSSGVYFYQLKTGSFLETRSMMLLK